MARTTSIARFRRTGQNLLARLNAYLTNTAAASTTMRDACIPALETRLNGPPRLPARVDAQRFYGQFSAMNERIRAAWFPEQPELFSADFGRYPEFDRRCRRLGRCRRASGGICRARRPYQREAGPGGAAAAAVGGRPRGPGARGSRRAKRGATDRCPGCGGAMRGCRCGGTMRGCHCGRGDDGGKPGRAAAEPGRTAGAAAATRLDKVAADAGPAPRPQSWDRSPGAALMPGRAMAPGRDACWCRGRVVAREW